MENYNNFAISNISSSLDTLNRTVKTNLLQVASELNMLNAKIAKICENVQTKTEQYVLTPTRNTAAAVLSDEFKKGAKLVNIVDSPDLGYLLIVFEKAESGSNF